MPRPCKPASPFRYFNSSPEVIRLVVMMYVRFPLSLRKVEDLLFQPRNRQLPRDRAAGLEQVRSAVRRRHPPPAGQSDARLSAREVAPRRGLPSGEFTFAVPTTGAGDAQVPADEEPAEVRLGP